MDIEFSDLKELYKRLEPALATKVVELKRNDYDNIDKKDIWEYLAQTKWSVSSNLQLHQMVNDILNTSNEDIALFANNR